MKRTLLVILLAALGLVSVLSSASAQHRRGPSAQHYRAKLDSCHASDDARSGSVEVDASLTPVRGTARLGLRFELYRRAPGSHHYRRVDAPRLFVWRRSGPDRSSFEIAQQVNGLTAPAVYEMRVGFRWYDRRGRVIATRHVLTRPCRQPDRRPDLRVSSVRTEGAPTHYVAIVENRGATDAGAFSTDFTSAMGTQSQALSGLAAGATARLEFDGPACTFGAAPEVRVDSQDEVAESRERNNRRRADCGA